MVCRDEINGKTYTFKKNLSLTCHAKNREHYEMFTRSKQISCFCDTTWQILNFLGNDFSDTENFVLSHDLNFGLPPKYLCKEEFYSQFESLWAQLLHHNGSSVKQCRAVNAKLADFAHLYCGSAIDGHHKEHFRPIISL